MEFETTSVDKSTDISDGQRFAASTKRITITPLHASVAVEDSMVNSQANILSGMQVGQGGLYIASEIENTSTISASTLGNKNVSNDNEHPGHPSKRILVFVAIGLFAGITGSTVYFFLV